MPSPRFYCPIALHAQQRITLPNAIVHHAVRVLRLRDQDAITLFNGQGGEYPATLSIQGKMILAHLGDHDAREAEFPIPLTLVQGLPASGKMDSIVEKAVELGIHTLVPVIAQRSPAQPQARLHKRLEHWHRIVEAASAQCGRNRLMHIADPIDFSDYLRQTDPSTVRLLCHPHGSQSLCQAIPAMPQALSLCIGPEGGWSDAEQSLAKNLGLIGIRFGARVLRTETAGIALVAAVQARLEGMGCKHLSEKSAI